MLNKIVLMGRLTRDPELRKTQSDTPVCSFSLAVDRDYKRDGEKETDFIDVVAWRSTAEFVSRYFTKGRMAVVEGRLQIRDWTDKEGGKHRSAEVIADNVYLATPNPRRTVLPALTLILVLRPAVSRRTLAMIARCRSKFKKSRGRAKCPPSSIYDERKSKLCQTVLSAKNLLLRALCCAATAPRALLPIRSLRILRGLLTSYPRRLCWIMMSTPAPCVRCRPATAKSAA